VPLGELRDQLAFYYKENQYEDFLQFFEFLFGKTRFSYGQFTEAFRLFSEDMTSRNRPRPSFMETENRFLQFLYEMNVISYQESVEDHRPLIHWCFRERTTGKLAPKVKTDCVYEVHYGLVPALNMGKERKRKYRGSSRNR
jgi:hypothetical protein